jgi:transcriptional regulator with XRE-family HTH domain
MLRINEIINALRKQRGWTMDRLSAKSYVSRTHISNIENGRIGPSLATAEALLEAMGYELTVQPKRERLK